ncbi:hypothetical protein ACIQU5_00280 [Streptomyces sp. NPDC090306]|uniref:hypothetical protein n=1 Tax=Streptomyces sp. NPDC090306 TaxID=3365961 RepID=UPI0038022D37
MSIRRTLVAAGLLTAALALTGCGGDDAGAVPDGWGTLDTKGVSVSYPEGSGGFRAQTDAERDKHNAAAAERDESGRTVALMTVQLDFTRAKSAEQAAIAAEAGIALGAKVTSDKDVRLAGTDEARRVDFTFTATGEDGGPAKGTPVEGVILTGLDSSGKTFAVRVDAQRGKLSDAELTKIVKSVEVH